MGHLWSGCSRLVLLPCFKQKIACGRSLRLRRAGATERVKKDHMRRQERGHNACCMRSTSRISSCRSVSNTTAVKGTNMRWKVPSRDPAFRAAALARQSRLTKPTGALGALEDVAVWLADLQQTEQPMADSVAVVVFASDHPVSQLGVSAYPREVTAMMVVNMASRWCCRFGSFSTVRCSTPCR